MLILYKLAAHELTWFTKKSIISRNKLNIFIIRQKLNKVTLLLLWKAKNSYYYYAFSFVRSCLGIKYFPFLVWIANKATQTTTRCYFIMIAMERWTTTSISSLSHHFLPLFFCLLKLLLILRILFNFWHLCYSYSCVLYKSHSISYE